MKKGRYILPSGRNISKHLTNIYGGFSPTSESELEASHLHMNHYPIQSKSYFTDIKSTRGDAYFSDPGLQTKGMVYFKKFDRNEVIDQELAYLARQEERPLSGLAGSLRRLVAFLRFPR
ncbi:MAG: hypothetical protein VKK05_02050 [Synechococcus sp.]|nr:hypothetical protein [Synechococcus sp.]